MVLDWPEADRLAHHETLRPHGYRDFVLCLGYRGQMIKEYFLNYEAMNNDFTIHLGSKTRIDYLDTHDEQNFRVTLADTGQETMTGGRIKRIQRHIDGDTFMVTYGDGVSDVDIDELLKFHRSHGRLATVTAMQPPSGSACWPSPKTVA